MAQANLFELIRRKYLNESMFKDLSNESSPINLTFLEPKKPKEKFLLRDYDEIDDDNTGVQVKTILTKCKSSLKKILVLGRAGVGKSTFCQNIIRQWAKGNLWSEYELVVLVCLRNFTEEHYPGGQEYSPIDIIKKEYSLHDPISKEEEESFNQQCKNGRVLWIFDGYDELAQNIPPHLNTVFNHLCQTQHHILTSHPYAVGLPYDVKLEITGFTDAEITNYVESFFNGTPETEKILQLLKSNPNIWDSAHVPANLQLICNVWSTRIGSSAMLYESIVQRMCQQYLEKQNKCDAPLKFVESLAFKAMESNSVLLSPQFFNDVKHEYEKEDLPLVDFGILKSYEDKRIGEQNSQYYFVHVSFEHYFAARYLINLLKSSDKQKAIDFIKKNKYIQRFRSMFVFAFGLLAQDISEPVMQLFWDTIQEEPLDLVGLQHIKLIIELLNEVPIETPFAAREHCLQLISQWMVVAVTHPADAVKDTLEQSLEQAPIIVNTKLIQNTLARLAVMEDQKTKLRAIDMLAKIPIAKLSPKLFAAVLAAIHDTDRCVQSEAFHRIGQMGRKAATNEMIDALLYSMYDQNGDARAGVCTAFGNMGEKAATNAVITALRNVARRHTYVGSAACLALEKIGGKSMTSDVIAALVDTIRTLNEHRRATVACKVLARIGSNPATADTVLGAALNLMRDRSEYVVAAACEIFENMGGKAATKDVLATLFNVISVRSEHVVEKACAALKKIGVKCATMEIIDGLLNAMADEDRDVNYRVRRTLVDMSENGVANAIIRALLNAIHNKNQKLRKEVYEMLRQLGQKAATDEVIGILLSARHDADEDIRENVYTTLERMGKKAATGPVIAAMLNDIRDQNDEIRSRAYSVLGRMGEKAATGPVIAAMLSDIRDQNEEIRKRAYSVLGQMGEKAAPSNVIAALLDGIHEPSWSARKAVYLAFAFSNVGKNAVTGDVVTVMLNEIRTEGPCTAEACRALGNLGEKDRISDVIAVLLDVCEGHGSIIGDPANASLMNVVANGPTEEVIAVLLKTISGQKWYIRYKTCDALGTMGEKAATNAVIVALLQACQDKEVYVRKAACRALGKMGEKAATDSVISCLLKAFADKSYYYREVLREAVEKLIDKDTIGNAIKSLLAAITHEDVYVRRLACQALGKTAGKCVTNQVITALVKASCDAEDSIKEEACKALGKICEKEMTDSVIAAVMDIKQSSCWFPKHNMELSIVLTVSLNEGLRNWKSKVITEVFQRLQENRKVKFERMRPDHLLNAYLDSGNAAWLDVLVYAALVQGVAITTVDNKLTIYHGNETLECSISSLELRDKLLDVFKEGKRKLNSVYAILPGSELIDSSTTMRSE